MPPLHGTVALVQVEDIPVPVPDNLNLDVFGAPDKPFDKNRRVTESGARLGGSLLHFRFQLRRLSHHAHPAAAAAESSFDDEREPNLGTQRVQINGTWIYRVFRAGYNSYARLLRQPAGGGFVA